MKWFKGILPIILVVLGILLIKIMFMTKKPISSDIPERIAPLVQVAVINPDTRTLHIFSQGTALPQEQIKLVTEVAGRVIQVNPKFRSGGSFAARETLFRIDPIDYELALVRSKAQLALALLRQQQENAAREIAHEEWQAYSKSAPSSLAAREPQRRQVAAEVAAAQAAVASAARNLEKTHITAPFGGMVQDEQITVGQFIVPGQVVGVLYSTDTIEVRLPVRTDDLKALAPFSESHPTRVTLTYRYRGTEHSVTGTIARQAPALDPGTRMAYLIAEITNEHSGSQPVMPFGAFVSADITGKTVADVFAIPASVMRDPTKLLVINGKNQAVHRNVTTVYRSRDTAIIRDGLHSDDRVCLSILNSFSEGMAVRIAAAEDTVAKK